MQAEKIKKDILRINNIFSDTHYLGLLRLVSTLSFKKKQSTEYSCSYILLDKDKDKHNQILRLISKLIYYSDIEKEISLFYDKPLELQHIGEIVKIQGSDFLETHIDDYNFFQAVIHLNDYTPTEGGILTLDTKDILPIKNSIIIFPGKTPHSVSKNLGSNPRYSISLGFTSPGAE